jgi:L-2,4-diaminobutyrate transaminase
MLKNRDELEAWDRDYFLHPATHAAQHARGELPRRVMEGGEGVYVWDSNGNRLIDGFGGLFCVNIGYGRTEVADAIAEQARKLAYFHAYAAHGTEAAITLAKMVVERAPKGMSKVFFGLSGSDANETNVKLAWYYNNVLGRPKKKKIIARWRAYHGSGVVSGSLTGLPMYHKAFDLPIQPILHTEAPYYFRRADRAMSEEEFSEHLAAKLEELILAEGPDTVAGFIGEPMMGTGGLIPPPKGYWPRIQKVLETYDVLLLADEVVCGFGRLGSMFGCEHYGIKPDFMAIAKGLTSAYAPISGSIISERVWKAIEKGTDAMGPLAHAWTYSAHPICAAAGVANLELIDKLGLVENTRVVGKHFLAALRDRLGDHRLVGDIRGEGLLCAVELVADRNGPKWFDPPFQVAPKVMAACAERGLIVRAMPQADILGLSPPLCITKEECDEIVRILGESIEAVAKTL